MIYDVISITTSVRFLLTLGNEISVRVSKYGEQSYVSDTEKQQTFEREEMFRINTNKWNLQKKQSQISEVGLLDS